MATEQQVDYEQAEALGISHEAYDEVLDIVGRIPTVDELSTLLAMWESNGKQQSLYGWLRGQKHSVQREEYLYRGSADHKAIREPKVKECIAIAKELLAHLRPDFSSTPPDTGTLLYMVGNVSTEFADSEYASHHLHMAKNAVATQGSDEECRYIELILEALHTSQVAGLNYPIGSGGLFVSLFQATFPRGFDILAPREVRLDAFLFGEESGRYIALVDEKCDDQFLLKLGEARLNCCFLGRTTKNRLLVDGFDMGAVASFV